MISGAKAPYLGPHPPRCALHTQVRMAKPKKALNGHDYPRIAILSARGLREIDIARELGMAVDTWRRIRAEDARAEEAWQEGRGAEHETLVGVLYKAAVEKGNIIAAMFLLKTRHGYVEGAPQDTQHRLRVTFELPGALKPEDYARIVNAHPTALPPSPEATRDE